MDITEGPSDDADRLLASDEPERPGRKQPVRKCYERVINRRWVELFGELWGEFIGTFFVVLVTLNINATDVTLQEEVGLWEIAIVTGLGVSIATYATSHFSNSHFNPALTLAFAIARWKVFSWKKVFPYIFVQLFAGFLAASVMYGLYGNTIARFENRMNITRGSEHSVFSAKVFVQYFPNPSFGNETADIISPFSAFGTEAWAMGILAFMIFSFADPNNSSVWTSPTLGIWDHLSGAYGPQLQGLLHQPGDTRSQHGDQEDQEQYQAEWVHQPNRSIQPQPPPNGHLVLIRLQVWMLSALPKPENDREASSVTLMAEHIVKHCLTSSSKELRCQEAWLHA
eukprot:Em0246g11a